MLVCVLDQNGQPLMPTARCGKVRRLLKDKKAKVVKRCPFTIKLLYEPVTHVTQPIEVGDDTGSKHNGISAVAIYPDGNTKEIYASEIQMRSDITKLISERRAFRRSRRNRKTRYRKPRFNNRVHNKKKGWLAPSIENKINLHIRELIYVCSILPVTRVAIETASFDMQKLKADMNCLKRPNGTDYQKGEQYGFWNVREYVLFRDGHTCACCHGKSKDPILNIHHIESRQMGGDAPNNLITLCETCHKGYHEGKIKLPSTIKRGTRFKDAVFMGIMRWAFWERAKTILETKGIEVHMTYGYLTKNARIRNGLPKTHYIDARCISGHPEAEPLEYYYLKKKVRSHNRKLHKATISKGGIRKRNQSAKEIKGFRLFDKVMYQNTECFIFGKRTTGYFDLRKIDGTKIHASANYKHIKLLERSNTLLIERRRQDTTI